MAKLLGISITIISLALLSSLVFDIHPQVFAASNPYLGCPDCNSTSNIQQIPSGVTVTTNKISYNNGDTLTISGSVQDYISDTPIIVTITSPSGLVVKSDQVTVNSDRTYSESIQTSNISWQGAGTYHIMVQYGSPDRSAQTTFAYASNNQNLTCSDCNETGNMSQTQPVPTPVPAPTPEPPQPAASKIPHWVKTLFNLYGQGQVSDDDLINALKFLIQTRVIRVS